MKLFAREDQMFARALTDNAHRAQIIEIFRRKRTTLFWASICSFAFSLVLQFLPGPAPRNLAWVFMMGVLAFTIAMKYERDMRLLMVMDETQKRLRDRSN